MNAEMIALGDVFNAADDALADWSDEEKIAKLLSAMDRAREAIFTHKIGATVVYRGQHRGVIIGHGIEAGRPVYDVRLPDGSVPWGYAEQITAAEAA